MHPYQQDSYKTQFSSTVTAQENDWVQLYETYFYPTSGGQPHDTGVIESGEEKAVVTDVELRDGHIWHKLEGPLPNVGAPISARIDWPRRYRHMQRHSAQHLLSQVFLGLDTHFETRSVSLRGQVCTLDLGGDPTARDLAEAEKRVNRVAFENLEIEAFEIDEADVPRYPLRRPPKVSGRVRLVQMGDFELSACGGTHLRRTAEALPIKLLGLERIKGGLIRVAFMAGWEALEDYRSKHEGLEGLARSFSAQTEEVPARVAGLRQEHRDLRQKLNERNLRLTRLLAEGLRQTRPEGPLVYILQEEDADLLDPLAQELVQTPGTVALLAALTGERTQLIFAKHEAAPGDMREALNIALEALSGKGGGSPLRAQGSGSRSGLERALDAAARSLEPH